jgi:hypothetical protein
MIDKRIINLSELQSECWIQKKAVEISVDEVVGYINNVKFTLDQ